MLLDLVAAQTLQCAALVAGRDVIGRDLHQKHLAAACNTTHRAYSPTKAGWEAFIVMLMLSRQMCDCVETCRKSKNAKSKIIPDQVGDGSNGTVVHRFSKTIGVLFLMTITEMPIQVSGRTDHRTISVLRRE